MPKATAVPPGYGAPSDPSLFDAMRVYLDDFVSAVDGEPTDVAALERMSASIRGSNKRGSFSHKASPFMDPTRV